jgi:hypothetical protein
MPNHPPDEKISVMQRTNGYAYSLRLEVFVHIVDGMIPATVSFPVSTGDYASTKDQSQ